MKFIWDLERGSEKERGQKKTERREREQGKRLTRNMLGEMMEGE